MIIPGQNKIIKKIKNKKSYIRLYPGIFVKK